LTRSKKEGDPPLTRVLFDLTRRDFFDPMEKIDILLGEIFQIQTQTIDG